MNNLLGDFRALRFSNDEYYYTCIITGQNISVNLPVKVTGYHKNGLTNEYIVNVLINKCTATKIPKGLTKIFPNMKILEIWNSKLATIDKLDLDEYKNLEKFCCVENPISYLPGNLFEDFPNLEWIEFWGNDLQIIEPNLLDGLDKLKYVEFKRGCSRDKRFSMYSALSSNASLQEIKDELEAKYSQILKNVQKLEDTVNQLKQENENLKGELEIKKESTAAVQYKSHLLDDIEKFLLSNKHKDFIVKINQEEFHVHKFLLAARSPILAEMLLKASDAESLNLVEISSLTFKHILNFIYTDEFPTESKANFVDLFAATGRLQIKALQDFAAINISAKVTGDNALDILQLGVKYDHDSLKINAFNAFKKKYSKFQLKDELLLQPEKLKKIIETLKKKEEKMRRFEKEFESLVMD